MTQVTGTSKLPTPARRDYVPGDVINGKYRLLQLLGEGGMGSVWVAENTALNSNVALKLIRADVAEASANERFLSEARLAARLQHAAIVRVFDFGKTEIDEPFIVMELLDGETLGQRLARLGSIDPMELCQTLLPIIDALHFAHGHGVIHRDLKPDNVFIAKTDGGGFQPKLLDFGIAKLRGESPLITTKLTQAGTLIGSPDYMSPEQARGETDLDPRSDVWALCVLAYECLVGKPPFYGDNYNALLWAIIHDEPVPITVFQAGDSELWRLLKAGFSKDRTARWENARRFGEAVATWLDNHGVVEDICNRSLHATWLPAERPTRPELAPFDPLALPPQQRIPQQTSASPHAAVLPSAHVSQVPPATLAMVRRPHAGTLWFAGLGLLALLAALYVTSEGGDDDAVAAEPAGSGTQVDKAALRIANPTAHPGGVAEQRPSPAPAAGSQGPASNDRAAMSPLAVSPLAALPLAAAEPISDSSPSSWTRNHEKTLKVRDLALAKDFKETVNGSENGKQRSTSARRSSAKPAAAPAAPRPKASPAKKTPADKNESAEVDFGI